MYDVIYYLYRTDRYPKDGLRLLYKYEYYLTSREKQENPKERFYGFKNIGA